MKTLMKILGYGWAILGAANIVLAPHWGELPLDSGSVTFLLMFNMLLFIIPGMLLGNAGNK